MVSLLHFTAPFAFVSLHPSVPGVECLFANLFDYTSIRVYASLRGYTTIFCQS